MTIIEPTTTITDYVLGAVCLILAVRLFTASERRSTAARYWALTLAATALAALIGGTVHGFRPALGGLEGPLWIATLMAIGVASLGVVAGTASAYLARVFHQPIVLAVLFKLIALWVLVFVSPRFGFAVADYGLSLVIVAMVAAPAARKERASARALFAALGISLVAAIVLSARVSFHPRFNQNDLYHVIQVGAMYALYRAARLEQLAEPFVSDQPSDI